MTESQRVVLTGSGGFLGSHVARYLVNQGGATLLITHNSEPPRSVMEAGAQAANVMDKEWEGRVDHFGPTCVIHAATRFQVGHDRRDIAPMVRANVELGAKLLDLAHGHGARFVTISSAWQRYEGQSNAPVNLYAATKQAFDVIADYYRSSGLDLARLYLFDVYGPGDSRRKLIPLLMDAAKSGKPLLATSGHQLIDLTFVDDVVDAVAQVAFAADERPSLDAVVKSGPVPVRQVAEVLSTVIGQQVPVEWGAVADREKEMLADWGLEPVLPNWQPRVSLFDGLNRIWSGDQE